MKNTIIIILLIILVALGVYFLFENQSKTQTKSINIATTTNEQNASTTDQMTQDTTKTVIGKSSENNDITAYHYGTGGTNLLFIAGVHGGYSWNTSLLAYQMMDYLEQNPKNIPEKIRVTIVPVLNPDGLNKTVGTAGRFDVVDVPTSSQQLENGRFNANNVDLNRNFDCDWQASGLWQNKTVSGGTSAFSEPETLALKKYIETLKPASVIVWYSAAGGVYASSCHNGVLEETKDLIKVYSDASKYKAYNDFNFYEITGDMVNWLAKEKIPAISIVLTNHTDTELEKNLLGIKAVFDYYNK
jgi:uncharacterized protein YxeA